MVALPDAWQTPHLWLRPNDTLSEASNETAQVDWDMVVLPLGIVVLPCALLAESARVCKRF